MQRGYCNHPGKKTRIVTEWKCVDIQYPETISPEERARRSAECRAKDYYGVCELCKYFKPDDNQPANTPAEQPAQPENKTTYTAEKPADIPPYDDPAWDSMMDEII